MMRLFLSSIRPQRRAGGARLRPAAFLLPGLLALLAAGASPALAIESGTIVTYEIRDQPVRAYLVAGSSNPRDPAIVLMHEWWGLNEQIRAAADRVAALGYTTIVPDLYEGKLPADLGWAHDFMRAVDDDWAMEVIDGALGYLRAGPGSKRPIGIVGLDMGGRLALEAALRGSAVQTAVSIYGGLILEPTALRPLNVPFLGIYARDDRATPPEQVEQLRETLDEMDKNSEIVVMVGVGRFFANEDRPGYDEEAASGAWAQTAGFLEKHLVGASAGPKAKIAPVSDAELEEGVRNKKNRRRPR